MHNLLHAQKLCGKDGKEKSMNNMLGWIQVWIESVLAWGRRVPAIYHKGNKYLNIGTLFSKIKYIWYMSFNISCYETIKIKHKHFKVVSETKKYLVHSFRHSLNLLPIFAWCISFHIFLIVTEYLKLLGEQGMIFFHTAYVNYHQFF